MKDCNKQYTHYYTEESINFVYQFALFIVLDYNVTKVYLIYKTGG